MQQPIKTVWVAMLAFVVAMVCVNYMSAQPLDSLVSIALERHPSLEAVQHSIDRTEAAARAAGAWSAPKAGVQFQMLPPLNPNPFAKGETMLMLEQEIPLFGQNKKMAQGMLSAKAVREEELAGIKRQLQAKIASLYYQAWSVDQRRNLNRQNRSIVEVLYSNVEARYELNSGSQADLYRLATEIERLDAELRSMDHERRTLQTVLNTLLVRDVADTVVVVDTVPFAPLPAFEDLILRLNQNPDLKKMEAMAAMNEANAIAAESMLDPMLMLRGGVALMPEGHPARMGNIGHMVGEINKGMTLEPEPVGLMVGAMISIPIAPWSRSGPEAQAESARLEGKQALAEREQMRQEMVAMLRQEYGMIERNRIWIEHYQGKQIPLLEQTLQTLQSDYINGRASFTALLDVYQTLVMAEEELIMNRKDYALGLIAIERIAGE